jgi:hypothetical protein
MFDELVDELFAHAFDLYPGWAVYLGLHDYDGRVPDWSADAVDSALGEVAGLMRKLEGLEDLTAEQRLDLKQLGASVRNTAYEWNEERRQLRNPMPWIYLLDPDLHLKRIYADEPRRARVVIELLSHTSAVLDQARSRLDPVLARTICEWGITAARGLAGMLRDDVVPAFPALAEDASLEAELNSAIATAADELDAFAAWIEAERLPGADESFAIGRDNMEKMLATGEMLEISLEELLEVAEADLARNLTAFRETAAGIDDTLSARQVYEKYVESDHAPRGGLVAQTEGMLEEIRSFLIDRDLITVPSEVRAKVAPTPRHLRWAFAMMDTPGPYETEATEAYYLVTPTEPEWDDEKADEWLRALNTFALEAISIHEAYPGHYVHFLHFANAPTETSRRLASYAFTEGWAHYTEQMMWEEGYREGDPRFRMAQLAEALVRNCRMVCSIRLHAHGMSVDEASSFFEENAYYPPTPARKEAERGTFDPGYLSYTVGKLQILRLREDIRSAQGSGFSLKQFHDDMLSRGAPPVELMREVLLKDG